MRLSPAYQKQWSCGGENDFAAMGGPNGAIGGNGGLCHQHWGPDFASWKWLWRRRHVPVNSFQPNTEYGHADLSFRPGRVSDRPVFRRG
jgi:hypothetical protein